MDAQPPPPVESGLNTGRLAGTTSNTEILGTHQERRHKLVHRDTADAATKHMTEDAHLNIVRKTGSRRNQMQHAVGYEYIHIDAIGGQVTIERTAGVCKKLPNEFIAAHNWNPPWSPKAIVPTVGEIQHHDVVSSGIFADGSPDKRPREWTKQALITLEDATEAYMVEVRAEFHC